MEESDRDTGQRLVHGMCGAFLAALGAVLVQFSWTGMNWWLVGGVAALGFALAWFGGEAAIEGLTSWFPWV